MIEVTIERIAELCNGELNKAAETIKNEKMKGVSIDTRTLQKGNLFVPFPGENADGHRFIADAFSSGAAVSLTEHEMPSSGNLPLIHVGDGLRALQDIAKGYLEEVAPKVIAITGSNGKTTTKDMVECLLAPYFKVKKTTGNYNNEIGLPLTILELDRDTEISILEMGMDAEGDIDFLSKMTEPDIAIITNVGESHIEKLGSRENIASAKYEIVNGLKRNGTFIYSRDYPLLEQIVDRNVSYKVRSGGIDRANDVRISNIGQTGSGTKFKLDPLDETVEIPQLGAHNAANAVLALLAAEAVGLSMGGVKEHFHDLKITAMRMEQIHHSSGTMIINDAYNASPSSTKSAIDTVGRMDRKYKVLVLSDILELGFHSKSLHESIGRYINESAASFDLLLTYGDAAKAIHDIADVPKKRHFKEIEQLGGELKSHLGKDTVVLLKGSRGMAMERVMDHLE